MDKYTITLTKDQMMLIANCVEDCHRFMAGQVGLRNMTSMLDNSRKVEDALKEVKPMVTPELQHPGASYGWSGEGCPNKWQRKFIAETYTIYREIYHVIACEDMDRYDVYQSDTLTCEEGGELPIIIKES